MASVKVNVELDPDAPEKIFRLPQCKAALTKEAKELAAKMNNMGASFQTQEWTNPKTKEQLGGKTPRYIAKPAVNTEKGAVALVVTGNYAAMADNKKHNTMLKARG